MFTGIVEAVGRVAGRPSRGRLVVEATLKGSLPLVGESIAVSGVCLTVVECRGPRLTFDVSEETFAVTTLGDLAQGDGVNLERALRLVDRLGGHLVSGHVDGVTRLVSRRSEAGGARDTYTLPAPLARYVAHKGSVALDGVSLTVAAVGPPRGRAREGRFEVALIPHTLAVTTLGANKPGDRLNVEIDLVARYLETLIDGGRRAR
jgi:riboflavin synthase